MTAFLCAPWKYPMLLASLAFVLAAVAIGIPRISSAKWRYLAASLVIFELALFLAYVPFVEMRASELLLLVGATPLLFVDALVARIPVLPCLLAWLGGLVLLGPERALWSVAWFAAQVALCVALAFAFPQFRKALGFGDVVLISAVLSLAHGTWDLIALVIAFGIALQLDRRGRWLRSGSTFTAVMLSGVLVVSVVAPHAAGVAIPVGLQVSH